ncbi:MAG: hypothetical protein OHK0029_29730 [Armatimonadaceae bacterium]
MPDYPVPTTARFFESIGAETEEWIVSERFCPLLREQGFSLAGWSHASDSFAFVRPHPAFAQVLACFEGRGLVLVEGKWEVCEAGWAYVTPPGKRHAYRAMVGNLWKVAWVHDIPQPSRPSDRQPALLPVDATQLYHLIRGVYTTVYSDTPDDEATNLWLRLLRLQISRTVTPEPPGRLQTLWSAVRSDLSYPWTVDEMAKRLGISDEHLRRLVRAETGTSPMRHLTHLRIQHAETLLASGRYTVGEVANRVGYHNPFAFTTAFKRIHGVPPSDFTRSHRGGAD